MIYPKRFPLRLQKNAVIETRHINHQLSFDYIASVNTNILRELALEIKTWEHDTVIRN